MMSNDMEIVNAIRVISVSVVIDGKKVFFFGYINGDTYLASDLKNNCEIISHKLVGSEVKLIYGLKKDVDIQLDLTNLNRYLSKTEFYDIIHEFAETIFTFYFDDDIDILSLEATESIFNQYVEYKEKMIADTEIINTYSGMLMIGVTVNGYRLRKFYIHLQNNLNEFTDPLIKICENHKIKYDLNIVDGKLHYMILNVTKDTIFDNLRNDLLHCAYIYLNEHIEYKDIIEDEMKMSTLKINEVILMAHYRVSHFSGSRAEKKEGTRDDNR